MSQQWKPGDVIADDDGQIFFVVAVSANTRSAATSGRAWTLGSHVVDADGNGWRPDRLEGAHRVVLIDPEDRAQVERLAARIRLNLEGAYRDISAFMVAAQGDALQAALRSLTKPPKPEEPRGRMAVVEDADAVAWVRVNPAGAAQWIRENAGAQGRLDHRTYSQIDARKVLSQGVPQ